jgi:hypothetical protein
MALEEENEQLRAAAHEVLDHFERGDRSEALDVVMMKLRPAAGIPGHTYEIEEEIYRTPHRVRFEPPPAILGSCIDPLLVHHGCNRLRARSRRTAVQIGTSAFAHTAVGRQLASPSAQRPGRPTRPKKRRQARSAERQGGQRQGDLHNPAGFVQCDGGRPGLHGGAATALPLRIDLGRFVSLHVGIVSAMPEDRRRFVRIRPSGLVPKMATIIDAKSPPIRCTVVGISAGGACLELGNAERLPQRFGLLHGRVPKRCLVVWRRHQKVGVQFGPNRRSANPDFSRPLTACSATRQRNPKKSAGFPLHNRP